VIERVLDDRSFEVVSLLLNPASLAALAPSLSSLGADVPVYVTGSADFFAITGFNLHRGNLALVRRPTARTVDDLLPHADVAVVLEAVADADNVGAVFRNAAAFGADAVFGSPTCCDPLYRKAIRTSMGASLRVPFARIDPWPGRLADFRSHGFTLVALTPQTPAVPLAVFAGAPPAGKLALILGTEGSGLSAEVEALADVRVRIPIRAEIDSLNLALASGIALERLGPAERD